jgi:hypothetical protein
MTDTWLLASILLAWCLGIVKGVLLTLVLEEPSCSRPCCDDEEADAEG